MLIRYSEKDVNAGNGFHIFQSNFLDCIEHVLIVSAFHNFTNNEETAISRERLTYP